MTRQFRTIFQLVIAATAVAVAPWSIAANTSASSTGTVVTPIAIAKATDLVFGKFAASTGGTVTVSTSGARSVSGAVIGMSGTPAAAKFDVTGEADATYSINLSAPATLDSGANAMAFAVVSDLTGANTTSGNVTSGTLTGGAQSIYVGGILTVASAQPPGIYSGSVVATVEYN